MGNIDYLRDLCELKSAETFLQNIVELKNVNKAAIRIQTAEMLVAKMINNSTLNNISERDAKYRSPIERKKLQEQIIDELLTLPRPDDDDKIRLGKSGGGSLPRIGNVKPEKTAYIIIGLPASGKSEFAALLSDRFGAIIVDNDFAKRKIPEFYRSQPYSANFVHAEASLIVEGKSGSLLEKSLKLGYNIIIPKIGYDSKQLYALAKIFKQEEYKVHLFLVSLDRQKATQRAYYRFIKTKRYVPLSLIFDSYSNDPIIAYYRLRANKEYCTVFESFGKISNDVPKNSIPLYVDSTDKCPIRNQDDVNNLYRTF